MGDQRVQRRLAAICAADVVGYSRPMAEDELGTLAQFGLAGIWENWKDPASGEWIRTFAIITTDANELVADIHDRMPVILAPGDYARWLGGSRTRMT